MMNKIKNIFKSKVTLAIIACLLLVGVFAGLTSLATETTPIVTIKSKNINHGDSARLLYNVYVKNVTEEDYTANPTKAKMHFWTTEPENAAAAPELTVYGVVTGTDANGITVTFESYDIAPKHMTKSIYCAAEFDGQYSAVEQYSVFQYLCEMNLAGASADQQALYDAMQDYIKYAQLYLGVDGTEFPAPDTLAYVKLNNCWVELEDGTKITDGVLPAADYQIHSNYSSMKVEDQHGNLGDLRDGVWYANLVANQALSYTAFEASLMTITVPANAELVRVDESTVDGAPAYTVFEGYETGAQEFWTKPADKFFLVPTGVSGKAFSGWSKDGGATLETTDVMYSVTPETSVVPTPVFKTSDEFAAAQTDSTLPKWNTETLTHNHEKIGDNQNASYDVTDLAGYGAFERLYWSLDFEILSTKTSVNYNNPLLGDFFSYNGSETYMSFVDHLQYGMSLGTGWNTTTNLLFGFAFTASNVGKLEDSIQDGFYLSIRKNFSDNRNNVLNINQDNGRSFMKYGEYHNLQFLIDMDTNEDDTLSVNRIYAFIDGNFVGSAATKSVDSFTYADNKMHCKFIYCMRTTTTRAHYKNFTIKEFD